MPPKRTIKAKSWLGWFLLVVLAWIFGHSCLRGLDAQLYGVAGRVSLHWGGEDYPQLHCEGEEVEMDSFLTEKRTLTCPVVGMVELNRDTAADCFAILPLGPHDYATLLNYLHRAGIGTIGVSSPLVWAGENKAGDMARQMFCTVLEKFKASALGLRGRTAAQADFTPTALRDYAIPPENIKGDPKSLASANRPLPNGLSDSPDKIVIPWAPDWLEDEPQTQTVPSVSDISFPLLVRWNGEIIPTLPFKLALQHRGVKPKDVRVTLGKEIRFGGRTLPLDEYGRTRLKAPRTLALPLTEVVGCKGEAIQAIGAEKESCVILAEPQGEGADPARLALLAQTLSELAGVEHVEYLEGHRPAGGHVLEEAPHQKTWWTLLWAIPLIAAMIRFLPFAPSPVRRSVAFGFLACILYSAYSALTEGLWLSLSAALLAWCIICLALRSLEPEKQGIFHHRSRW